MSECIRDRTFDDALYKSTYTLLYFTLPVYTRTFLLAKLHVRGGAKNPAAGSKTFLDRNAANPIFLPGVGLCTLVSAGFL